jgi:uncharacterized cofD-like protein
MPDRPPALPSLTCPPPTRLSRVVALGGGTGLPAVLTGLRRHLPVEGRITALVASTDDGGSSGILREQYGVLPPGDMRNCLLALASIAPEVEAALQYRLDGSHGPQHPVGNLLLTALSKVTGDEVAAIRLAAAMLGVEDVVLPSTIDRAHLVADLVDGRSIRGESRISRSGASISRLRLDPPDVRPAPGALDAIRTADIIVLGPGSLYTSVLATLVVPGLAEAVATAPGLRIFVCNLMTEPGQTDGYGVTAHLEALAAHGLPARALEYVVVNTAPIPPEAAAHYAVMGASPVQVDVPPEDSTPIMVLADVLEAGAKVRHSTHKLGALLCTLGCEHLRPGEEAEAWPFSSR